MVMRLNSGIFCFHSHGGGGVSCYVRHNSPPGTRKGLERLAHNNRYFLGNTVRSAGQAMPCGHTQGGSTVSIETLIAVSVAPPLNSSFSGKCLQVQNYQPVLDNGSRGRVQVYTTVGGRYTVGPDMLGPAGRGWGVGSSSDISLITFAMKLLRNCHVRCSMPSLIVPLVRRYVCRVLGQMFVFA